MALASAFSIGGNAQGTTHCRDFFADSRGTAERPGTRIAADQTPFENLAVLPVERIRAAAQSAQTLAAELRAALAETADRSVDTPNRRAAMRRLVEAELVRTRRNLSRIQQLLELGREMSARAEPEAEIRLGLIRDHLRNLPRDPDHFVLRGPYAYLNSQPVRWITYNAQFASLREGFLELVERLKMPDYVLTLRASPNVLRASAMQRLLQEFVVDGVEYSILIEIYKAGFSEAAPSGESTSISRLFKFVLFARYEQANNFDPTSDHIHVQAPSRLLESLVRELVANASEAGERRHGSIVGSPQWRLILGTVRVRSESDGGARIEIEDFGNPSEYSSVHGVGNSSRQTNGFGIGRYRAQIIAALLGFRIDRVIKPDYSGSIIRVHIPSSAVLRK